MIKLSPNLPTRKRLKTVPRRAHKYANVRTENVGPDASEAATMKSDSIIDLLANPKRVATLAERERTARRGAPGWHGLALRFEPQISMFGELVEITAHPRSPAYQAGLRNGDKIGPFHVPGIGEVLLQNIYAKKLPAGTEVEVPFFRPGAAGRLAGKTTVAFKLARWPRMPEWEKKAQVACGKRVAKTERLQFLERMVDYLRDSIPSSSTAAQATRYLLLLITRYDNPKHKGVWPTHGTIAKSLGLSRRRVHDLDLMLRWFGVLRLLSWPTRNRNSNLLEITWPDPNMTIEPKPTVPTPPTGTSDAVVPDETLRIASTAGPLSEAKTLADLVDASYGDTPRTGPAASPAGTGGAARH
jgi:hypothetical protein